MNERRTLITGGAGFIGSHLVERLIERGDHVVVLDNLSTGRLENLADLLSRSDAPPPGGGSLAVIESSVSDWLRDRQGIRGIRAESRGRKNETHGSTAEAFDEIYHLAASVGVRLVIEQPIGTIENNIDETAAILEFASESNTPILIASTSEVYGKSTKTPFRENDDVVLGPTIYPRWSYACSKAIDEYLALAYHRERGLPVVIARFFNTVGPRQVGDYGMVVPRFVERALRGETIEVHGDGRQTRCFCDVRDVVDVLPRLVEWAVRNEGVNSGDSHQGRQTSANTHSSSPSVHASMPVFNVGSDQPIRILELAELVCRTLDSESEIRTVSYEQAFGPDFDDLRHRQPDLARLRTEVGFSPKYDLTQTIRDIAEEMKRQPSSHPGMKA